MPRIKIEDLPPFEELTPEEQAEVTGAGRAAFLPMFGPLESAAFHEVAVAYAVSPPLLAAAREAAPERALFPGGAGPVDHMLRALARDQYPDHFDPGPWPTAEPAPVVKSAAPPPAPAPAPPAVTTCDRATAQRAADLFFEVVRGDVLARRTLFQVEACEYRGVTAWDLDAAGRVRGFTLTVRLEFASALPGFDARPGDLVLTCATPGARARGIRSRWRSATSRPAASAATPTAAWSCASARATPAGPSTSRPRGPATSRARRRPRAGSRRSRAGGRPPGRRTRAPSSSPRAASSWRS